MRVASYRLTYLCSITWIAVFDGSNYNQGGVIYSSYRNQKWHKSAAHSHRRSQRGCASFRPIDSVAQVVILAVLYEVGKFYRISVIHVSRFVNLLAVTHEKYGLT